MTLYVRLNHVVDLSDPIQQRLIGTNRQELTGIWRNYLGTAPTQELGQTLFDLDDLEAVIIPSSLTDGRNLLIFPDQLEEISLLRFNNEINGRIETLV